MTALEGVDFMLRRGEVVCLLGDNGAGKSTLIKILSGVYQQDRGSYWFDGQCLAIARAKYRRAKLLILDEPTSALGVVEARRVLRAVRRARREGLGVVLVTHNVNHAYPVGDRFTILSHGRCRGPFAKQELSRGTSWS